MFLIVSIVVSLATAGFPTHILSYIQMHTVVRFSAADVKETIEKVVRTCETYDPNTIRAAIPMYLLAEYISKKTDIRVIVSGEGADELFGGYNFFRYSPNVDVDIGYDPINEETGRLIQNIHMFDLLRADRCFAAWGIEVRVPFLDQSLVKWVNRLPGALKINDKKLLRDSFNHLDVLKDLRIL